MNNNNDAIRRRDHASEIILSGHVWSAVWFLAWPTAISTIILTLYNLINRVFLGRLGVHAADSLAAAGIGGAILNVQFALAMGLSVGASALVARFLGARTHEEASETTRQAIILSIIGGIVTMIPLVAYAAPLVRMAGARPEVVPLAADYLAIISYCSVPFFLFTIITAVLRSAGDVRNPLYVGAAMIAVNIVFDYLLIFGVGPFPALGVKGAAIATAASRVVGMVLIVFPLRSSTLGDSLSNLRPDFRWFWRIIGIGFPAAVQNLLWTAAAVMFVKILSVLPNATDAQAAYTVALTIESTAFMPGVAYAVAATPLVGQNLGARQPDRAQHSAWVATGQAVAIMTLVAILFVAIPRQLALMFTSQPTVVSLIASYLIINAISEPFLALGMVLRGALQGAGDVIVPTLITLFSNVVLRLPLTWILAVTYDYGAAGAWVAMSGTTVLSGILSVIWFKMGRWRSVEV